jgi:hypothetical protein
MLKWHWYDFLCLFLVVVLATAFIWVAVDPRFSSFLKFPLEVH